MRVQLTVSSLNVAEQLVTALEDRFLSATARPAAGSATVEVVVPDVATAAEVRRLSARLDHPSAARRLAVA